MSSALRILWFSFVLVDLYCVLTIQVPTYPQGYSERHNNHPKALRQTSGYRIQTQNYKKQTHRGPHVYRQQINFNSPAPLSDAIRIVDPPSFFQEQKKYYQKAPSFQIVNGNLNKPPTASAWKQREPSFNGNDYHLPPKAQDSIKHVDYRQRGQHLKQMPIRHVQAFHQSPQSFPPKRYSTGDNRQEYHQPTTSAPKRETPPNTRIRELQEHSNSPKYITSHRSQTIAVEQPRPTPTYLGIQNPNSGSIRAQLQDLKERQKSYFEDDDDHFPISPKTTPKKYSNKPKPSSVEMPISLGHDIYNEENNQFHKTKLDYFGVKTHVAAPTTQEPETSDPTFVPFKLLASVRHTTRVAHKKRNPEDPRAKARFKTQQAYTVHSEQAFEEGQYDHGDEERHVDHKKEKHRNKANSDHPKNSNTKRTRTKRSPYKSKPKEHLFIKKVQTVYSEQGYEDLAYDHGDEDRHANYTKKYRPKRSTNSKDTEEFIEELEELPVALSLVGPGGEKLTGKALINHITELLKNASKYLPEDETNGNSDIASVILPPEELNGLLKSSSNGGISKTFSEHHLDTSFPPVGSPKKYIDKISDFNASPYEKNETNCGERNYNFEQNNDKKKLGDLGKQLDCYKEKFFGNNPFSNPFFSDDIVPVYSTLKAEVQNPSSLVYDDVMNTIQNSLKSEKHLAALPVPKVASQRGVVDPSKFESFTHTSTISPNMVYKEIYSSLPIFDITKYFPKVYMIRPNGKIYSIKFRPKQSSIEQSMDVKKIIRNAARNDKGKTSIVSRNLPPKRRVIEPANVYRFSHEDAVRRPRQHLLRLKTN